MIEVSAVCMWTRALAVVAWTAALACHPPQEPTAPPVGIDASVIDAASAALTAAAELASGCHAAGDPTGKGKARVVYANDGSVKSVQLLTSKFSETLSGSCVRMVFLGAKIEPFLGPEPTFIKYFELTERI
jgi:hypothetical protein